MPSQAHWSDEDIDILLTFLTDKHLSAGDGISFKLAVWNEAAVKVNAAEGKRGGNKTAGSCKSKWEKLKETFHIVEDIKSQSGFTWSDEFGADIHEENAEIWAVYERKHPGSAPFRNKGWPWFERVQPLIPPFAHGANVYRASIGSQEAPSDDLDGSESQERPFSDWDPSSQSGALIPQTESQSSSLDASQPLLPSSGGSAHHLAHSSAIPPKHPHVSGPHHSGALALRGMNDKLEEFTDVFRDVMSGGRPGIESTPARKTRAMKLAQDVETTISDKCVVRLIDLFQTDVNYADAYLALTRDGVRKEWVDEHTRDVREGEGSSKDISN